MKGICLKKGGSNMANCTDCEKFTFCSLVENGDVDVYAEAKEKNCDNFEIGE